MFDLDLKNLKKIICLKCNNKVIPSYDRIQEMFICPYCENYIDISEIKEL